MKFTQQNLCLHLIWYMNWTVSASPTIIKNDSTIIRWPTHAFNQLCKFANATNEQRKKICDLHVLTIETKSSVILSLYYSVVLRKFSHSTIMVSFIRLIHGSFFKIRASIESLHLMRFLIAYTFANFWQYFFSFYPSCPNRGKKLYWP